MEDFVSSNLNIPKSVAIIMDGNGRWAIKRGLPRSLGHREGAKALENLIPEVGKLGIKYITVYAFSTENWKRPDNEIESLMQLFKAYAPRLLSKALSNNVRIRFIGDRTRFKYDVRKLMDELEIKTQAQTGLNFVIAANYGGRDEIRRAALKFARDFVKKSCSQNVSGHTMAKTSGLKNPEMYPIRTDIDGLRDLDAEVTKASALKGQTDLPEILELTEKDFSSYLDTAFIPEPDLLIRTSGEMRLSNFLLWEIAYSEIIVTDCLWPDFNREELVKCIKKYNQRNRRFGGV